jgi:hypothetical protein
MARDPNCDFCLEVQGVCTECDGCFGEHCQCDPCAHNKFRDEACVFCVRGFDMPEDQPQRDLGGENAEG